MEKNQNNIKKKETEEFKPFTPEVRERILEKYKNRPKTPRESNNLLNELMQYTRDYQIIGWFIEELDFPFPDDEEPMTLNIVKNIDRIFEKEIQKYLRKISDRACRPDSVFAETDTGNACLEIIACTERIARLARELPASMGIQNAKEEVNEVVGRTLKIIVEQTREGWLKVKLPFILPKKEKGSSAYLRDVLYCALQDYFSDREPVKFDHSVIVVKHVYGEGRKDRMRCDHDNFEINFITDAIALFALPDDSPEHCKMFSYSERGEKEHSCIYLVPEQDFMKYYSHHIMRNFS